MNSLPQKGILLFHLNIHSLLPKIEELRTYILNSPIKILCINETFLDSSVDNSEIQIPGFHLFRNDFSRNCGGVALYFRDTFSPYLISCRSRNNHVEGISVQIHIGNTPFIISSIYRRPVPDASSFVSLENYIEDILTHNCNTVFLGDFNINYLNSDVTKAHAIENQYQLKQLITDQNILAVLIILVLALTSSSLMHLITIHNLVLYLSLLVTITPPLPI